MSSFRVMDLLYNGDMVDHANYDWQRTFIFDRRWHFIHHGCVARCMYKK